MSPHSHLYAKPLTYLWCLCVLLLSGCAAQIAYRDGRDLAERGQGAAALVKFEEAANLDKGGAQYRIAVLQTRENLINAALAEAEVERLADRAAGALSAFNRVIAIQPNNSRALEGIKALDDAKRHAKWLSMAQVAMDKKDTKESQLWLRMIILENPKHVLAQALLQLNDADAPKIPSLQANTLATAYRKPITIEFKDAQLKTVFEVLSRTSGLNFILDKDIRADQKTSIFLKKILFRNILLFWIPFEWSKIT